MRRSVSCLTGFVFLTLFLASAVGLASEKVFSLNFDPSDLIFEKVGDYDRVRLVGATFSAEPGTPLLPVRFVQIAIPAGLEVERVEVVSFDYQELPGTYQLYPGQPFYPVSEMPTKGEEVEFVEPDPSVYQLSSEYPGKLAALTNNGFLGGQHIAGVALYPLQYIPAEGKLILYTRLEFELIFKSSSCSPAPVNRRTQQTAEFYSDLARSVVMNPEAVRIEARGFLPQEEEVHYLIITDDAMVSTFQELADWKTNRAILTEVRRLAWVVSNYDGYDDQEKIRNCIRDYYANRGTRWVLLGGDTDILPHRIAPVMGEPIPCDLYFSDLDSNWDANGNHIYGEYPDLVDMYPDVFVGRAPSNDVSQAQTFVDKSLIYETDPAVDYLTRILYAAEVLWPGTDGAECKNYIDSSFVPGYFQATKLYETSGNLNRTNFEDGLNYGQNIINHNGHGNFDVISLGHHDWYSSDMDNLTNAPRYSLFYTFGCITAAIDMDCIGEHFINNPGGGGFAYCGNTRYGWGLPGYPLEGPGAEFDIEFFRALFDSSAYQVGKTLGDSKIPFIPISQDPSGGGPYYRWTEFTLVLLGDPTLELWTDTPAELAVSHNPVFFAGMSYFVVNVVQDDALVSCVKDGQVLGTAYSSGGSAMVDFGAPLLTMGTMHVTVTKHNHMPYHDTVLVIPPEGPYVIYYSHQNDDSQGNNNGVVNPGEPILMPLTVKNIGIDTAYGVSATLREDDDNITLTDSVQSFGDIDSGMTAESLGDYAYEVDGACPDSHVVRFTMAATDGDSVWETVFFQMVVEPDFVITASTDTALVRQGDSTTVKLILTSLGGFNWQVDLTHTPLPPGVTGFLDPDQLVPTDSSMLRLFADPDAPLDIYSLTITASGGEKLTHEKELVLAVAPPAYYGPVWHVATDGHDIIGNGSEQYPFRTIQRGINSAASGDTVLVEKGTYVERVNFFGKAILVASHFIFDGLEATIDSTVIDGNSSGAVVTFNSGEGLSSVIRGFTITNGYSESLGGGVFCFGSSPTISENFIVENECGWGRGGPGIYLGYSSNPLIYRNLVANCIGPAAIFLHVECTAQVINNTVCDNTWGGLSIQGYSSAYVKNNIFCSNVAYGVHADEYSSWNIQYNDVYGQDDNYALIPDQTGINGNISADPLFLDQPSGDYHLTPSSPCIDAGDPYPTDMGAFEYVSEPTFALSLFPEDTAWVHQADSTNILVIVTSFGGFDLPVDLSFSELPTGVTGVMDPNQVIPTDTAVFTIEAAAHATPGFYPVTVTATGGDITRHREIILAVLPPSYDGPVWHVSTDGDDQVGNGSADLPFRTIQKGINTADSEDTVLVEKGTYLENIDFLGKGILVASHFIFDNLVATIESTIINGFGMGSVVTFNSGEGEASVLRGFTLTGGLPGGYGGAVYCYNSSPTIMENFLVGNVGFAGSAIYCYSSDAKIYRNLIANSSGPAAVFLHVGCDVEMINNTVCDNDWGGVSIQGGSVALLKNNIICNNVPYGIHATNDASVILYNDVYGHTLNYEGIPDQTGINGNISEDPLFLDASTGDYRLTDVSPCIDAGDPADSVPPGGGDRIDMGVFEYRFIRGDANGDGVVDVGDVVYLVNYLFAGGPPPYPLLAGDANSDGNVDVADVVYLINYLYRDGPPPGEKSTSPEGSPAKAAHSEASARLWLSSSRTPDDEEIVQILLRGSFEVDIAAVQLTIGYDPEELTLSPALPARLSGLAVYSSQKDGLLKMGIVDLKGETYIPAGKKVDLLILEAQGANLTSLRIKEAILADRQGSVVPVKIGAEEGLRPESFSLFQNYPNPFNPETQINYALPQDCQVRITVYNLLGQRVRTLVDEPQSAGYRTVHWDGKDEQGVDVASGVYFYKIKAGDFVDSKKMLLLK